MSTAAPHWQAQHMAATTAFTPVKARTTLASSNGHSNGSQLQASSNPPPVKKVAWPLPVRDYVQRSFAPEARIPGIEVSEMETKLKATITEAAERNTMDVIDWATLPLPQQLIQQERTVSASLQRANFDTEWPQPDRGNMGDRRKRKSEDDDDDVHMRGTTPSMPPWRKTDQAKAFGDRVTHANQIQQRSKAEKRARREQDRLEEFHKSQGGLDRGTSKFQDQIDKRRQRFGVEKPSSPHWNSTQDSTESYGPVVGTSQKVEKNYFRIVGPCRPDEIRPLEVLRKTLALLKKKWKAENNYLYICDQFKSLRQDLTVQHIKNSFTIEVYELHARIALEWKDLGEYNQCQTQLRALYAMDLGGNPAEFLAYRILYFILTCDRAGLNDIIAELTPELKAQAPLSHALAMRSALASGNYHKFFRLYLEVPNMGGYLVDQFLIRERLAALANICRSYLPNVSIKFLTEELGFESYLEAHQFLAKHLSGPAGENAIDNEKFLLETRLAAPFFEAAKLKAFATVDIKGQI